MLKATLVAGGIAVLAAAPPCDSQLRVTSGAAPGYVDDALCATCHEAIAKSYREVGMSRSFSRPRREAAIESIGEGSRFTHVASRRTYEMVWRGNQLLFRRYQTDSAGAQRNLLEQPVDWILGSGNHARTYLYRAPSGELFQLPVAWYAEERRFAMAPGYDRPDHEEVGRRVRRECMFCHNAYPDAATGTDARAAAQTYPEELPEGTGCQRCHGPGGEHATLAMRGAAADEVRGAIVNPAKLPPARRDDVCYQCHLQPSVAIPGTRRFGRADYSFRPGQALGDYLVPMDVDDDAGPGDRFEINHHPYRLRSSRCAQASGARLSCLTCHDPHRKVPAAERAAHYRAACLGCHAADALPAKHAGAAPGRSSALASDCTSCHMPRRRPRDVVHTVMTDHRIGIYRDPAALVAPLAESEPDIADLHLYALEPRLYGREAELYRALAATRAGVAAAVPALERLTSALQPASPDPYLELVPALLHGSDLAGAQRALDALTARAPDSPSALAWSAVLAARQGRSDEAVTLQRELVRRFPDQPEGQFNLGQMLATRGLRREAIPFLTRATELRPNLVPAWAGLAAARHALGDLSGEENALRRAIAVDPGEAELYVRLSAALEDQGRTKEGLELLRFAHTVARHPERIALPPD